MIVQRQQIFRRGRFSAPWPLASAVFAHEPIAAFMRMVIWVENQRRMWIDVTFPHWLARVVEAAAVVHDAALRRQVQGERDRREQSDQHIHRSIRRVSFRDPEGAEEARRTLRTVP